AGMATCSPRQARRLAWKWVYRSLLMNSSTARLGDGNRALVIFHCEPLASRDHRMTFGFELFLVRFDTAGVLLIQVAARLERAPVWCGIAALGIEIFLSCVCGDPGEDPRCQRTSDGRAMTLRQDRADLLDRDQLAFRH